MARDRTKSADVHDRLADLVLDGPAAHVVDLGAGRGPTLAKLARRAPRSRLTALDINADALSLLSRALPCAQVIQHDLARPLPIADASVDAVLSHNTLECLLDPGALLVDVARVLRRGGRALLGHTDFETLVVTTSDEDLARRVLLTYAELPVLYRHMAAADPRMGRRLPGLVRHSPLRLDDVHAHTTVHTSLDEAMTTRLTEVVASVRRSAGRGAGHVTPAALDDWVHQLRATEADGNFLYSETAYLAVATRSG